MKKKTLLVSALSVFLLALSACDLSVPGGSSEAGQSSTPAGETSSEETTNSSESGQSSSEDAGGSSQQPGGSSEAVIDVTSITLNKGTLTLDIGAFETLTATVLPNNATHKEVTWTVDHSNIATVVNGKVTGVAAGSAIVTARAGNQTATCNVTVNPETTYYTVTFDKNGGTGTMNSVQVADGAHYSLPECAFTREHYSFAGWQVGSDATPRAKDYPITVTADVAVKALWTIDQCTLTFEGAGATSGSQDPIVVDYGTNINLPNNPYTRTGYHFAAWHISGQTENYAQGDPFTVNENATVTPVWEENPPVTYTVSFDANGGSGEMADVPGQYGNYNLPTTCSFTAPADKEFKCWLVGEEEKAPGTPINVEANVTVKAVWEYKTFYLYAKIGTADWAKLTDNPFVVNTVDPLEYQLTDEVELSAGDKVTVVDKDDNFYPDGMGTEYTVEETGFHQVYFKPHHDGGVDWHYNYFYVDYTEWNATFKVRINDESESDVTFVSGEARIAASAGDYLTVIRNGVAYSKANMKIAENNNLKATATPGRFQVINNVTLPSNPSAKNIWFDSEGMFLDGGSNINIKAVLNTTLEIDDTGYDWDDGKIVFTFAIPANTPALTPVQFVLNGEVIKNISIKAGTQNIRVKNAEQGIFEIISQIDGDGETLTLARTSTTERVYEVSLGGYNVSYALKVGGVDQVLEPVAGEYVINNLAVTAGQTVEVWKDGLKNTSFSADEYTGNNLNGDMEILVAGTVSITVKPATSNVWVSGYAYVEFNGTQRTEIVYRTNPLDENDHYYTADISSADKDAVVTVFIGGTEYTAKKADQANNNVRIKPAETALKVIKAVSSSQPIRVYPEVGPTYHDAYVFLGGYEVTYEVTITRAASDPIVVTLSGSGPYTGAYTVKADDIITATEDGLPIDLVIKSDLDNNLELHGDDITVKYDAPNTPISITKVGNEYQVMVQQASYVATIGGTPYTLRVNPSNPAEYMVAIPVGGSGKSVEADQSITITYLDAPYAFTAKGNKGGGNNIWNDSGTVKVFKTCTEAVTLTLAVSGDDATKAWLTGYYPTYQVNGVDLVAKYQEEEPHDFIEWGANLNGVANNTVLTFTLDGGSYTPTREDSTYNNVKLESTQLKVITGGNIYVALKANGEIWVTGYAQVTVGANTYNLERVGDEYRVLVPTATATNVVTVKVNGSNFTPLTASTGSNNLEVVDGQLKVRQTVNNMTIYVHDDKSVWLDGYVEPLNPVTNYAFSTSINPGEGKYIFVHSWSSTGSRTSYVHDGVVGIIENATGYCISVSTNNVESNAYPDATKDDSFRTVDRSDFVGDTIIYQLTGEPAVYNAYMAWNSDLTRYDNKVGYKNSGQANYTGLACGTSGWTDGLPYKQYTYSNNSVTNGNTVTIAQLVNTEYQPITSNISFENNMSGKMTLEDGVVTFLFDGTATLYIKVFYNSVKIWAEYTVDGKVKVKFTVDNNVGEGSAVYIAGGVNSWTPERMEYNNSTSKWEIVLDVAPGDIEYKYIKASYDDVDSDKKWEVDQDTTSTNHEETITTARTIDNGTVTFQS